MNGDPTNPSGLDPKLLAKVRGLLAKAESTTFPEEAGALTAKAQQLMARHAIDAAMLDDPAAAGTTPEQRTLVIDPPYVSAKLSVLGGVAAANRCQVVFSRTDDLAHAFGFGVDLDVTEVLYTSLLLQATTEMNAAGSRTDRHGRSRTRSFRHAFLLAFAGRVADRLMQAAQSTVDAADHHQGGALVPVLVDREIAVGEAMRKTFPQVVSQRISVSSNDGVNAGRAAGDRADIGGTRFAGSDEHPRLTG